MQPSTRHKVESWKAKFKPVLYRTAPSMSSEAFKDYIYSFENDSNRRIDRRDKITRSDADEIFKFLMLKSRRAEQNKREKDIIIVHDDKTLEWRGKRTNPPDAALGIKRNTARYEQLKGSYRAKLGDIEPCSKAEMLETIAERFKCDEERARQIFATAHKASKAILYHSATNTWRGCYFADMPTPEDAVPIEATLKQTEYRLRYGKMPPRKHNYFDITDSEVLHWLAELDGTDLQEAAKVYNRIWHVSRDPEKIPFVKDKATGLVRGVDYVEPVFISDEMRAKISALEHVVMHRPSFFANTAKALNLSEERTKLVMDEAFNLKLWGRADLNCTKKNDDGSVESFKATVYAGCDWWNKRAEDRKQRAEKEASQNKALDTVKPKPPHGWPEKLEDLKGPITAKLIFAGMTTSSLQAFVARAKEFFGFYPWNPEPPTDAAEKLVSKCVEKGEIVKAFGKVGGKLAETGYKLA
jgi:hypothetical protein